MLVRTHDAYTALKRTKGERLKQQALPVIRFARFGARFSNPRLSLILRRRKSLLHIDSPRGEQAAVFKLLLRGLDARIKSDRYHKQRARSVRQITQIISTLP